MGQARLFYVIGASGVGKDSVMNYARENSAGKSATKTTGSIFAHRYITRPAHAGGENHVHLSPQEFLLRQSSGCFAMHWQSHGWSYGVGKEIELWMNQGLNVVVNGSRAYLPQASALYNNLTPVLIHVDPTTLKTRLLARGRENASEVEKRMLRAQQYSNISHPDLQRINNNHTLEHAGEEFLQLLGE